MALIARIAEAVLAATVRWPAEAVPNNPRARLATVASRRLVDRMRSDRARREREAATATQVATAEVPDTDDTLVLLFLCCHPDCMVTLETPRLILRRWREEDVAPMAAINADPEVMRWIRDGSVRDEQQTRAGVQAWESEWESQGFGLFAVEIRSTGELAGFTGLSVPGFLQEVLPAVEAGWRLGRSHWGQGLATEAAVAAVRFGFEERGLERIVSITQVGNDASERIATKLGMRPVRETVNPTCGRRVRVFELSSDQYVDPRVLDAFELPRGIPATRSRQER